VANDAQVLGVVDVSNVSDLMLLAGVELFPKTFIQFTAVLLDRGNETYVISPYVPLTIEAYTGRVQIAYVMSSQDNAVSPLIEGSIQLASGLVSLTSNYAARSFAVNGSNLRVYLDILETTEAKVHVYAKNAAGVVVELTRNAANSTPLDNNWVRMPFELTGQVGWTNTSISIALVTSHVTARAYAMNLMSYIY
jgi:hypothetical protein